MNKRSKNIILILSLLLSYGQVFSLPAMNTAIPVSHIYSSGKLKIGERIKTRKGIITKLQKKEKRSGTEPVYNLEIYRNHNFYEGEQGLLVHNSYVVSNLTKKAHSIDIDWTNIKSLNSLKIYKNQLGRHYTASGFWNAKSTVFFDQVIDNKYYIKYDIEKGRLLFGDIDKKEILGFYIDEARIYPNLNAKILVSDINKDLKIAIEKLKI